MCAPAHPLRDYTSFHNGIVHSLGYGRISVSHLRDFHPATVVWEASPVSLVTFCTAFTVEPGFCVHLCSAVLCTENGFWFCVTDKIEEAQKELKDPKGPQKGKRSLIRTLDLLLK